jgi:hypothetical protein
VLGPASDELDTNELVYVLERMVRHLLSSKSKTIKSPRAAQNAANRDPTPFQTLSIYRDAMKEDELALRFDTMTLGMFPVQIMRIIQNALRRSNDSGMNGLDERYAVAATIAFLSPRIRKTGSMVWSESLRRSAHSSSKPSTASMNSLTFALSLIAVS